MTSSLSQERREKIEARYCTHNIYSLIEAEVEETPSTRVPPAIISTMDHTYCAKLNFGMIYAAKNISPCQVIQG